MMFLAALLRVWFLRRSQQPNERITLLPMPVIFWPLLAVLAICDCGQFCPRAYRSGCDLWRLIGRHRLKAELCRSDDYRLARSAYMPSSSLWRGRYRYAKPQSVYGCSSLLSRYSAAILGHFWPGSRANAMMCKQRVALLSRKSLVKWPEFIPRSRCGKPCPH